jgi:hypothetical protein
MCGGSAQMHPGNRPWEGSKAVVIGCHVTNVGLDVYAHTPSIYRAHSYYTVDKDGSSMPRMKLDHPCPYEATDAMT